MPTLLEISSSSNYGAPGKITEQIGLLAQNCGWDCYIAHGPRYVNPSQLHDFSVNSSFDEKIHGLFYSLLCDRHGLGSTTATKHFIERIKHEIKPDLIHLHNLHGYFLNYKLLFEFLRTVNIPVVWTLHDSWTFTGHCTNPTTCGCTKFHSQCEHCPEIHEYPKALIDNSASNYQLKKNLFTSLGNRLTLIPVSYWLERLLRESFFKTSQILTIHNGIDISTFTPQNAESLVNQYNLQNKLVILGVASPWRQRKGLYDFFKLRDLLSERYAIILVGLDEKQISELPKGIIGIQCTQSPKELAQFYSLADVFINMTYEDNYPTVNMEAMACGTPVITYDTGGSSESITESTGRVVEQGNLTQIVAAIKSIENFNQEEVKKACRIHAESIFDKHKCFLKYIDLYNKVLNK